jgi:hypothetical protein
MLSLIAEVVQQPDWVQEHVRLPANFELILRAMSHAELGQSVSIKKFFAERNRLVPVARRPSASARARWRGRRSTTKTRRI